ncbi:iron-containing alcohol dehydrogenase [Shinella curvata]|uniref:Iron-containing alcohol dehydrogenase n=1 Tax=Shinella curvata TaxID=1817964 RepID=A0ABT8XMB4_9HYPH|nr:iron-containing alcohol dehydrogenase [Shinella curvata]MCJ8056743.1 iron-containing alcohol dehydrogenase [Shinella curvata]MDO6124860.1 iron-containing alcohol dehydrogenase [Shinella curvata]
MPLQHKPIMEMFDTGVTVFGAPGRYIQGQGAWRLVGDCAATLGARAVLVIDATIRDMLAGQLEESCAAAGVELQILSFAGHLGAATGAELQAQLDGAVAAVLAAGGGRAIDAGKALAEQLGSGLITLPTVASNDAPTSKNFVLYEDGHRMLEVRHLMRNPDFVIVDTDILSKAPKALFRAGMGDALAKKFEAEACFNSGGGTMFLARSTRLAHQIADTCYETLMRHGAGAWAVVGTGNVTEDFDAAVEAMILMAGLGFESGGLSLPHALTRGIPLLPGGGDVLHGIQVAWALIVHFEALGFEPPPELVRLYNVVGLPLSLQEMGVAVPSRAQLAAVAEATLAVRHIKNLPLILDAEALIDAILRVEEKAPARSACA